MKYNYIFVSKLNCFKNFKIVSPATFVNKSYKLLTSNIGNIHAVNQNMLN